MKRNKDTRQMRKAIKYGIKPICNECSRFWGGDSIWVLRKCPHIDKLQSYTDRLDNCALYLTPAYLVRRKKLSIKYPLSKEV